MKQVSISNDIHHSLNDNVLPAFPQTSTVRYNTARNACSFLPFPEEPVEFTPKWVEFWRQKRIEMRILLEWWKEYPVGTVSDLAKWLSYKENRHTLTKAFFTKEWFWKTLIDAFDLVRDTFPSLPTAREWFWYRLEKIGAGGPWRPRSIILAYWVLEPESIHSDERGVLTIPWLQQWCHEGYIDPSTGMRVFGKDILESAYRSGNFWSHIQKYSTSLTPENLIRIGGKFPVSKDTLAKMVIGGWNRHITTRDVFDFFHLGIPENTERNTKGPYLSDHSLKKWYHEGYIDPPTGMRVFGKDILESAYRSGNFWSHIQKYSTSLTPETIISIGGLIPSTPYGYKRRIKQKWLDQMSVENIFLWFGEASWDHISQIERKKTRREARFHKPNDTPREIWGAMRILAGRLAKLVNEIHPELSARSEDFIFIKGREQETYTVRTKLPPVRDILTKHRDYMENEFFLDFHSQTGCNISFSWSR